MARFYSEPHRPVKNSKEMRWKIFDRHSNEHSIVTVYGPNLVQLIVDALNKHYEKKK